jgi:hypothetical protein
MIAAFAAAIFSAPVLAQSSEVAAVDVTVTVRAPDGKPAAGADITLSSGRVLARTDARGVASVHVAPGTSLEARKDGASSETVVVASAGDVRLDLRVVIGSARAKAPSATIGRDDTRALLSGDAAAGLAYNPQGRAPSQGGSTRFLVNGVEIELPVPPNGDVPPIPGDLIDSATPERAADGTIATNYQLASPSKRPVQRVEGGLHSDDGMFWRAASTGPGYAFAFARRFDDGVFDGSTFRDSSGQAYPHDRDAVTDSASAMFNHRIGTSTLAVTATASRTAENTLAFEQPGALPLGFGPGNHDWRTNGLIIAIWSAVHGRDAFRAVDVRFAGTGFSDLTLATLGGLPLGANSGGYRYSGHSDSIGMTRNFGDTALSIDASTFHSLSAGISDASEADSSSGRRKVQFGITRFGASLGFGMERSDGAFAKKSFNFDAALHKRITGFDANVTAYAGPAQTQLTSYVRTFALLSPGSAAFTCNPASATVTGPSEVGPVPPRATTVTVDAQRVFSGVSVHLGAFVSRITNALVQTQIADASAFPAGYVDALGTVYAGTCGSGTFNPANALLTRWETVPRLDQREVFVELERHFGAVAVHGFVERFDDRIPLLPVTLTGARTDLIAGAQLPQIVPLRLALTVSAPLAAGTFALGVRTIGTDNAYNRAPAAIVDSALRVPLRRGALVLSVQNLFATDAGSLALPAASVARATTFGEPFPTLAVPLPTAWSIRYLITRGA